LLLPAAALMSLVNARWPGIGLDHGQRRHLPTLLPSQVMAAASAREQCITQPVQGEGAELLCGHASIVLVLAAYLLQVQMPARSTAPGSAAAHDPRRHGVFCHLAVGKQGCCDQAMLPPEGAGFVWLGALSGTASATRLACGKARRPFQRTGASSGPV